MYYFHIMFLPLFLVSVMNQKFKQGKKPVVCRIIFGYFCTYRFSYCFLIIAEFSKLKEPILSDSHAGEATF